MSMLSLSGRVDWVADSSSRSRKLVSTAILPMHEVTGGHVKMDFSDSQKDALVLRSTAWRIGTPSRAAGGERCAEDRAAQASSTTLGSAAAACAFQTVGFREVRHARELSQLRQVQAALRLLRAAPKYEGRRAERAESGHPNLRGQSWLATERRRCETEGS
ncbi:hypothetical protein B0H10DRAFT_1939065 [Mycena sp. CBHHK59/15]|nr:hypothetical protein B0H10DRAFT_1939065 [Mycena sp. CBHHK59/15]